MPLPAAGPRLRDDNVVEQGLEFDVVVMVGIEDGKIPFFNSKGAALDEDRRKFYVSLTRARHAVHVFYSGWFQ